MAYAPSDMDGLFDLGKRQQIIIPKIQFKAGSSETEAEFSAIPVTVTGCASLHLAYIIMVALYFAECLSE
jgi:hypothetical protein